MDDIFEVINQLPDSSINQNYISNRKPLVPNKLIKLPIGSIKPDGWLLECLNRQKNGLTGHLGEISVWLQKKNNSWLSNKGKGKWGWEEVPYWLRGYISLGYVLNDEEIIKESNIWIESVLKNTRDNGDFGPIKKFKDKSRDFWANMVMLNCLQTYYEFHNDNRVIELMRNFFKYELSLDDEKFLTHFWQFMRGGDNLYSVLWLYNITGDDFLLDLAKKIHRNTANWSMNNDLPNWHNVNIAQGFREPAIYYQISQNLDDLQKSYINFLFIREKFGQVPGGMWGGDENSRPGYIGPRQGIETCGIVEHMFSDEILMGITGDSFWADHCEEITINTLPAAFLHDFKALRYITCPNMVISDSKNHHPGIDNKGPFLLMNPFSSRCCQHNHSFGFPYYSQYLWMATQDNGVCAMLYAPSSTKLKIGDGKSVELIQSTKYPFEEEINIQVKLEENCNFPMYLRIPKWCNEAILEINNNKKEFLDSPSEYIKIIRNWQNADKIILKLKMSLFITKWDKNKGSITLNYGPHQLSLKIDEKYNKIDGSKTAMWDSKWQKNVSKDEWPSFEIIPNSSWNYGLILKNERIEDSIEIIRKEWPKDNFPFTLNSVPLEFKAKGKKIPEWQIEKDGLVGHLMDSPVEVDTVEEEIILIPMGAARLRISAFPKIKDKKN